MMYQVYLPTGCQVKIRIRKMDTVIFVFLIIAIAAVMTLRIYLHQRRSRDGAEATKMRDTVTVEDSAQPVRSETLSDGQELEKTNTIGMAASASTGARVGDESKVQLEVAHVYKSFGGKQVVEDVSFILKAGEVFGLVGPNGAGKSTTIRMLMDIIKPDSGEITVFGQTLREETKNRIGYLPEERGLYQKMKVTDSLVYLSRLKSVDTSVAKERARELLKQVDMLPHKDKKISELSRGMGQIIQFLVTISHDPDLIILDEPFAGLDPVNRMLIKTKVLELKQRGKAILLSTHLMNEVEEMCDRILMINHGRVVLYGDLAEIKWRFRNNSVIVSAKGDMGRVEGITGKEEHGRYTELFLDSEASPQKILSQLVANNVRVERFEVSTPSLNEIFLQVVKR